ncbi:arsenate reductase ArsC [Leptobacterium flavescens]|uniref:Arsenate reductase ArsC n=1 Tax=Leptobacterium flavescens TaxID=472055 RepID=A0A6P0UK75_9FLAO|nr:arsenate reductase ArsC [Leptobacterium flavescens]NER12269.1 arsenate reductase ArsC [Leptobacterium flavescens]
MKKNVLVLCTGNSCRSQMAHGYLRQFSGEKANVYSAGVEIHGLNPFAVGIMSEDGIDISTHTSNHVDEYDAVDFDYVITVCDHANESCPIFASTAKKLHHNFTDPSKASGTAKEIIEAFRATRNDIKAYCRNFVAEHL